MEREQGMNTESHGMKRTSGTSLWVRAKRRGAEVVRTCAGVAAGWKGERRGTFLVLVVGVLALLSVIAIVYSAIGVGDRTRSSAVVKADRVNQVPEDVRDWIAGIIAGDVLDVYYDPQPLGSTALPRFRREATDYPWTEWSVTSDLQAARNSTIGGAPLQLFTLTGGVDLNAPRPSFWLPGDPWLASTSPTWIRGGLNATRHGQMGAGQNLADHERDWMHISNIAPDGRYVNLYNLRGNFEALPGINPGEMSAGLSLLKHDQGSGPFNLANWIATDTDFGVPLTLAMRNQPAYWSNRQVGLFRPVTSAGDVGNSNYFNYQYADADGDGFYDSRWQELVNASDPNNVFSVITKDPKYRWFIAARIIDLSSLVNVNTATDLITPPSAEVPIGTSPAEVDLWRLLTQVDFEDVYGVGLTGAGVVLTTQPLTGASRRHGYDALPGRGNPGVLGQDTGYYDNYDPAMPVSLVVGSHAYRSLRLGVAGGLVPPLSVIDRFGNAMPIADDKLAPWGDSPGAANSDIYAYDMGLMATTKRSLWKFDRYVDATLPNPPSGSVVLARSNNSSDGAFARRSYYERRVAELGGAARNYDNAGTVQSNYTSPLTFGLPDLSELLTRYGLNDPEVRSPLEMAMAGRTDVGGVERLRFSPMRDNRSLAFELAWDVNVRGTGDGLIDFLETNTGVYTPQATAYRGRRADVRQYLTPISGARPLASVDNVDLTRLDAKELKIDLIKELYTIGTTANSANWTLGQDHPENIRMEATRKIFRVYADALLGESARPGAWDVNGTGAKYRTLFYGYGGPEKAAYFAAFSAMNMQAMALPGSPAVSGPYTLILGEDGRDTMLNAGPASFPEAFAYNPQTGLRMPEPTQNLPIRDGIVGNRLDINASAINPRSGYATNEAAPRSAPTGSPLRTPGGVATLYPAEAQPFITAVSCFTVYSDAPEAAGGDVDYGDAGTTPPTFRNITIKPAVREDNPDFLFRVLAFQLHNPTGQEIQLGSGDLVRNSAGTNEYDMRQVDVGDPDYPAMDRQREFYYIKYGNRTFKLIALSEGTQDNPYYLDTKPEDNEAARYFDAAAFAARTTPAAGQPSRPALLATSTQQYQDGGMLPVSGRRAGAGIGVNAMTIRIPAGRSVVCYALSQPPQTIIARMAKMQQRRNAASDPATEKFLSPETELSSTLRKALYKAFGGKRRVVGGPVVPDDGVSAAYWIPEINAPRLNSAGLPVTPSATDIGYAGAYNEEAQLFKYFKNDAPSESLEAFGELLQRHLASGPTPEPNKTVLMYRTRRFGTEAIAVPTSVPANRWDGSPFTGEQVMLYPKNEYGNDQLVDRFRLPQEGGEVLDLDSRIRRTSAALENNNVDVTGTSAREPDSSRPVVQDHDDTGFTMMLWAMATRPNDPNTRVGADFPVGVIPGFCIEPRVATNWNTYQTWKDTGVGTGRPQGNDFDAMPTRAELTAQRMDDSGSFGDHVRGWYDNLVQRPTDMPPSSNTYLDRLVKAPSYRGPGTASVNNKQVLPNMPSYEKMYPAFPTFGYSLSPTGVQDAPTGATAGQFARGLIERNLRRLRVTDALLPLAVGGVHVPNPSGTPDVEEDWRTLGEVLALTMGFDAGTGGFAPSVDDVFRAEAPDFTLYPADTAPRPLSSGNLVLDAYAPFEMGGSGRANPVHYGDSPADRRSGLQVPLALGVLDRFSTVGVGSLTEMVPGVVNANTMPQMVARTVPMLAPNIARARPGETLADAATNGGFKPKGPTSGPDALYWWGQNADVPQVPGAGNNFTSDLPATIDVTAALISYRDKGTAFLGLKRVMANPALPVSVRVVDGPRPDSAMYDPTDPTQSRVGRTLTTMIDGISEQPGFKSLGEIMCARKRDDEANPGMGVLASYGAPFNIDFGGYNVVTPGNRASENVNDSYVGVDGSLSYSEGDTIPAEIRPGVGPNGATKYVPIPSNATTFGSFNAKPNIAGNEQGEKLMLAAGALGSLSVRSDVYAVWFVLHGYQRTDCEGLGPNDPLTPSIARRFMMVVDRSNVVKKGDTPKILMFKEVPLN